MSQNQEKDGGYIKLWGIFLCIYFLSNCTSNYIQIYPDFIRQKDNITNIHVLGDVLFFEDIKGRVDKIDLIKSQELWQYFVVDFTKQLKKKGYFVSETTLTSCGSFLDDSVEAKVVRNIEEKQLSSAELETEKAPFYVDKSIENNFEEKNKLFALYEFLDTYVKKKGAKNEFIKEEIKPDLGTDANTYFIVMIAGRSIPLGKRLLQGLSTALVTLGTVAISQTGGFAFNLFIIDGDSGEIIWAYRNFWPFNWTDDPKLSMRLISVNFARALPARNVIKDRD